MAVTGELKHVWTEIKAHPYVSSGIVFVVGAVLVYLYFGGSSSAAPAGGVDTSAAAAQVQSEAVQAQYAASLSAQQNQLQAVATQVNGQVTVAQLGAATQDLAITQGAAVASQSIAAVQSLGLGSIAAQQTLGLASIGAGQTVALGSLAAQVDQQKLLFDYLNNQVTQQYGFLNNQVNQGATIAQDQIAANLLASEFLNNNEFTTIEGQISNVGTVASTALSTANTASGNVVTLGSNVAKVFPWAGAPGQTVFLSGIAGH